MTTEENVRISIEDKIEIITIYDNSGKPNRYIMGFVLLFWAAWSSCLLYLLYLIWSGKAGLITYSWTIGLIIGGILSACKLLGLVRGSYPERLLLNKPNLTLEKSYSRSRELCMPPKRTVIEFNPNEIKTIKMTSTISNHCRFPKRVRLNWHGILRKQIRHGWLNIFLRYMD